MAYFLYGLFFVSCLVLIGAVLLQPGKTDAGALFTSNVSSTAYSPRGAQTVLSKMTIIAATIFMLSALLLSIPGLRDGGSVMQNAGDTPTETIPAIEANQPINANPAANTEGAANLPDNTTTENKNAPTNAPVDSSAEKDLRKKEQEPKKEEPKKESK